MRPHKVATLEIEFSLSSTSLRATLGRGSASIKYKNITILFAAHVKQLSGMNWRAKIILAYSLIHRDTRPEPAIRCSTLRGATRLPVAPNHRSEARLRIDPKVLVFVETLYSRLGREIAELLVYNRIKWVFLLRLHFIQNPLRWNNISKRDGKQKKNRKSWPSHWSTYSGWENNDIYSNELDFIRLYPFSGTRM